MAGARIEVHGLERTAAFLVQDVEALDEFQVIALLGVGALAAAPVLANQGDKGDSERENKSSLTDSVRRVERQTGGSVLSAEPTQRDGRQVDRVKVLTNDGRVRVVQVDSQQNRPKKAPPARSQNEADKDGGDPSQF